jgi:hypothetical protein
VAQRFAQAPQLFGSRAVSTQPEAHRDSPAAQIGAQREPAQ